MSKRQVLQDQYSYYLTQRGSKNGEACLYQFREIIQSFLQNHQQNSSNLNFLPSHLHYLFHSISKPYTPSNQQFTTTLQVLNYLLRLPVHSQFRVPMSLLPSLSAQLALNQTYKNSMNVIANIVWLICRCLQVIRDREEFMRSASKSGILERCLDSRNLDKRTQKGIMLLLNYMCKRGIEQQYFYLTLLRNVQKFSQVQMQREVFALLRRSKALKIIQSTLQCQTQLRKVLVLYLNNEQVAQSFIFQNHSLIVLAAKSKDLDFQLLKIQKILQFLLQSAHIDAERLCLKKVYKLFEKLLQKQEKINHYVSLALQTLHSNQISRRIFIQYHEKITYKQFLDILRGDYPKRLETPCLGAQQGSNRLKFLICMKRIANRLGVNNFYKFKLQPLAQILILKESEVQANSELVELLNEVSEQQQNILDN